eukprot:TRINITY_DN10552_c0_g2_i1.p1 TRINITY_DN10552_c0_g2~~TRINITY_DN10552_c0_g2_i1.p1  ORF type:complete len:123 (+),score=17.81 TRINITY_DN10552_c0_g2_i1:58-426(+)
MTHTRMRDAQAGICLCSFHFSPYFFFLMIRRPPRSTLSSSSAASDVYKRQVTPSHRHTDTTATQAHSHAVTQPHNHTITQSHSHPHSHTAVSYTHLRAHETPEHLVCRLLLEKKKTTFYNYP